MRKKTLETMQNDSTLSEIQRMAAGCLIDPVKMKVDRNLSRATTRLQGHYTTMSRDEAFKYIVIAVDIANDREWTG